MHSSSRTNLFTHTATPKPYTFRIKGEDTLCTLEIIRHPDDINHEQSRKVLAESFTGEYEKYLTPGDVKAGLTSWRDGDNSVIQFYQNYFESEFEEFKTGQLDYWVQATVNGQVVGWATFQREKSKQDAYYMNLLAVHPDYQHKSIGGQLVFALITLQEIPALSAINLLLRRKNQGGRTFYEKLGFHSNPDYQRDDNFVDIALLEGYSWKNPALQNIINVEFRR